jgi:hypothetical protein
MVQASILRNVVIGASITAAPLAICATFAEARGVGVGFQSQTCEWRPTGRVMAPSKGCQESQSIEPQMDHEILAEHAQNHVPASEAANLLDQLRLHLAAQPDAKLSIRWQLTRPAEMK